MGRLQNYARGDRQYDGRWGRMNEKGFLEIYIVPYIGYAFKVQHLEKVDFVTT